MQKNFGTDFLEGKKLKLLVRHQTKQRLYFLNCICPTIDSLGKPILTIHLFDLRWGKMPIISLQKAIRLVRHHLPMPQVTFFSLTCMEKIRFDNGFAYTLPQLLWCCKTQSHPSSTFSKISLVLFKFPCKATAPSPCSLQLKNLFQALL